MKIRIYLFGAFVGVMSAMYGCKDKPNDKSTPQADGSTNDPKAVKSTQITRETTAAWHQRGAKSGFCCRYKPLGKWLFLPDTSMFDSNPTPTPSFFFDENVKVIDLKGLPAVEIPFGLGLHQAKITDSDLKQLHAFPQLSTLGRSRTRTREDVSRL